MSRWWRSSLRFSDCGMILATSAGGTPSNFFHSSMVQQVTVTTRWWWPRPQRTQSVNLWRRGPVRPHRAILGTGQAAELHKDHGRHCKHAWHGTANTDSVFFWLFHHAIRCEDLGQVFMHVDFFLSLSLLDFCCAKIFYFCCASTSLVDICPKNPRKKYICPKKTGWDWNATN